MPDFRFYATHEESLAMLDALLVRGDLRLVLARQMLDAPEPEMFAQLTPTLGETLVRKPKVYLFGPYSTHPPLFSQVHEGVDAGRYSLSEDGGGPHVIMRLSYLIDGIIAEGSLWTQPRYWLTDTESTGPTPALKAAYADMVKQLKPHLVRAQGLYLSPGAVQLLKDGQAELPGRDKPLGVLIRDAAKLPQLKPVPPVPPSSRKTTRRKVAAKTATT